MVPFNPKAHQFQKLKISAPRGFSKALVCHSSEAKGDVSFGFILWEFSCLSTPFGSFSLKALLPALPYVGSPQKEKKKNHVSDILRNLSTWV